MCHARSGDAPAGAMQVPAGGREILPANVKPLHYDLTLEPNFEKFTYDGTVVIEYVGLSVSLSDISVYIYADLNAVSMSSKIPPPSLSMPLKWTYTLRRSRPMA